MILWLDCVRGCGAQKKSTNANSEQEKQWQSKVPNVQGEPASGAGVSTTQNARGGEPQGLTEAQRQTTTPKATEEGEEGG